MDIGKEVMTGKLNQQRLYSFMDEPAIEDRIDQILFDREGRAEVESSTGAIETKPGLDFGSCVFRSLDAVRALEKEARTSWLRR